MTRFQYVLFPMAIGSNLPPQAYTRDTLTTAFNWLQAQPESVKRMAPNPDALVALYMRSQRYCGAETEAPVSSQNFISDLKQLAEGLKQFEHPDAPLASMPRPVAPAARPGMKMALPSSSPSEAAPSTGPTTVSGAVSAAPAPRAPASAAANSGTPPPWTEALHPTSQAMVAQIKDLFNLNSDIEVVNMMIAVAHKSLKNLI